jgi:propionyl-CoA carboxylase beta chain
MLDVIDHIVDPGTVLEIQAEYARNIVCAFARIDGRSVGIVANQPTHLAGVLDINASEKAARFIRCCDAFNVPVVTLVDVPGFLPGTDEEHRGIIHRGAKLAYAYCEATVPMVTMVVRKAYGGGYGVMGSKHLGIDVNLAWPTAEIAVMGSQAAINLLYRRELAAADNPDELRAKLVAEYQETLATPYLAAQHGFLDAVIPPAESRRQIANALRMLRSKRSNPPSRKHGNIPL